MTADVIPIGTILRRTRASQSMDAAGLLSMMLLERDGEEIPEEVRRIDGLDGDLLPRAERSVERLLLLLCFRALPRQKRESIKRTVRCMAYGKDADSSAVELYNMLKRYP